MPRADGSSTNTELMADFTEVSRLLYIGVLNSASEKGFAPSLIDKPLPVLRILTYHHFGESITSAVPEAIASEELEVGALGEDHDLEPVPGYDVNEDIPEYVRRYRQDIRKPISEAVVSDDLDVSGLIVPGAVAATYVAHNIKGKLARMTNSWDERPSEADIVSAKLLADAALEHVSNYGVYTGDLGTLQLDDNDHDIYVAYIGLSMETDLPLNGHEPREFLESYYFTMQNMARKAAERLVVLKAKGASQIHIEHDKKTLRAAQVAASRALKFLDK